MNGDRSKLTLDRRVTYQIRVPGQLDESWADWAEGLTIQILRHGDGDNITILSGTFDQAGLLGLLRQLYTMGLPLMSVTLVELNEETTTAKGMGND